MATTRCCSGRCPQVNKFEQVSSGAQMSVAGGVPGLMSGGPKSDVQQGDLYSEIQGIMGNGYMGTPCEKTDACENITFPQLRWQAVMKLGRKSAATSRNDTEQCRIQNFLEGRAQPRRAGAHQIFTGRVCDSVNMGGVSASVHAGIPPQKQTPPWSRHPPPRRYPPWSRHPPRSRHPLESRLRHTVNERPVRILLECILVGIFFQKSAW